jgi:hypothetical protein
MKLSKKPFASVQMCYPLAFSLNWSNILQVILKGNFLNVFVSLEHLESPFSGSKRRFRGTCHYTFSSFCQKVKFISFVAGIAKKKHKMLEAFFVRPPRDKNGVVLYSFFSPKESEGISVTAR